MALAFFGVFESSQSASAAADPVIAAAGDIACDPSNGNFNGGNGAGGACAQKATYTLLTQINPAAVLVLGDNQYYCGGYQAFVASYALSWGQLLSKTYPSVGNHEYLTSGGTGCDSSNANAAGYFQYYAGAAKEGTVGQGWYSFDVGSWHLIAINSNCGNAGGCGTTSAQGSWLASDLAAHPNQCTLAFWHIPLWSSGGRAASNTASIVQQLYNAHADVILNGHDHIYERFAPQNPAGQADPVNGIREFIAGTGGANHTSLATPAANSEITNVSTFGVLKLTLHNGSYDWNFDPVAGQSFTDSGSQTCHSSGGGGLTPPPPSLTLSPGDPNDFVNGSTVFYRAGASGAFTVSATTTGSSVQFPVVFGSDSLNDTSSPFSKTYTWGTSASASGSYGVTATNSFGASTPASFTVTPDSAPPSTTASCNGGSCAGSFPSQVTVSLAAVDPGGSGPKSIYYTTNGTTPTTSSPVYTAPFSVTPTATVQFFAVDNVGNAEVVKSQTVTIGAGGGGGNVALVQQKTGSGTAATLSTTLNTPSGAGHALVAVIALAAGSSASVSTVSDPAGPSGSWTKGPIGYLTGSNSRVEIWYRTGAPSVTSVTVTLSASKALGVNVSEWSGVAAPPALDRSASANGASSTSVATPVLATFNAADLVIGAINYPAAATSTLGSGSFTSLNDFGSGSSVHGRAAYLVSSATGSFQSSWTLSTASGGHGTAILSLKADPVALDTTPPTTPVVTLSTSDTKDWVSSSTLFYNPSGSNSGSFTVAASTTDPQSPVSVQFPNVFTGGDGGPAQSPAPFSRTYAWSAGATASGAKAVTASSSGGSSSASFTATPDSTPPSSLIACSPGPCSGALSSPVQVTLSSAGDGAGSGLKGIYYTTDGNDPLTSGTPYASPFQVTSTETVRYAAVDNVGNNETPQSQLITISDPTPPSLSLSLSTSDTNDFVTGSTVFYNPAAGSGGAFKVDAQASDSESPATLHVQFPNVFDATGALDDTTGPFTQTYTWGPSSTLGTSPFTVTAASAGGNTNAQFAVAADSTPPSSQIACSPGPCSGALSSPVQVTLSSAGDGAGSGLKGIYYTTGGGDPVSTGTKYTSPFQVTSTQTVTYAAIDNVGNEETPNSQLITITTPPPPAPSLTLLASDGFDFVSGSTVFFNSTAGAGAFTVTATSAGASSVQFPDVFGIGDGGSGSPGVAHSYPWTLSQPLFAPTSFDVTVSGAGGPSDPTSFTVSPDAVAPSSQIACSPGPCSGALSSPVQVTLSSAGDGAGSGLKGIYYTTGGGDPVSTGTKYTSPFQVTSTQTVTYAAIDNVGNEETPNSQLITITTPPPPAIALVQQKPGSGSASPLTVTLNSASGAGHTLVAVIAFAAGSSASVSTVTDSAGGTWTKGPIGYVTGINSRVEIWYRLAASSVTSVTANLSSSKAIAVNVSEWSGLTAVDRSAGTTTGASSTTITTPSLTTTNANDLVIGAANYPSTATSTLTAASFTDLNNFDSGSGVHGRAAYRITSATGSYQSSWSLTAASGGHGTATIAFK